MAGLVHWPQTHTMDMATSRHLELQKKQVDVDGRYTVAQLIAETSNVLEDSRISLFFL